MEVSRPFEYERGIKALSDSSNLNFVPSKFNLTTEPSAFTSDSIPVVDFSALMDPDRRSKTLHDLRQACREWGFFNVVNHGMPQELIEAVFTAVKEFFNLGEDEKKKYEAKSASDPIKCGNFNVVNSLNQTFTLWRDYLKLYVHPQFHCPDNPQLLREAVMEYTERCRKLTKKLVEAICETEALELDKQYMHQVLKLDSSFQMFAANLYPKCPEPDQAIGLPPHTDPGLLTFLIHNGVPGLQIQHDGQWFNADSPHNSILVNVADQLEIFSNGECKSVKHRAVVNSDRERISIVVANGPSMEAVVGPAKALVEKKGRALYRPMKYVEYVETQLINNNMDGKSMLEKMMIQN